VVFVVPDQSVEQTPHLVPSDLVLEQMVFQVAVELGTCQVYYVQAVVALAQVHLAKVLMVVLATLLKVLVV
jgi:hypothetical protein